MRYRRVPSVLILVAAIAIALACFAWQMARIALPWHPASALPTPQAMYKLYLPLYVRNDNIGMGIAGGTDPRLQASWYYQYGWCDSPCTPTIMRYDDPVPSCPKMMLLWVEPEVDPVNFHEPAWHPITPELAAQRSQQIRQQCPNTILLIGNNIQASTVWMDAFLESGNFAWDDNLDYIAIHCYVYADAQRDCIEPLEKFRAHYPDKKICVTELAVLIDAYAESEFPKYLAYLMQTFPCAAAFTAHYTNEGYFPDTMNPGLVGDSGLTPRGESFVKAMEYARTIGY